MTGFKSVRHVKSSLAVNDPPHFRAGAKLGLLLGFCVFVGLLGAEVVCSECFGAAVVGDEAGAVERREVSF